MSKGNTLTGYRIMQKQLVKKFQISSKWCTNKRWVEQEVCSTYEKARLALTLLKGETKMVPMYNRGAG